MILVVGKIGVPVPGTPVQVGTHLLVTAQIGGFRTVQAVLFQAWKANVGAVYVGSAGMNKATGALVADVLPVPTVNALGSFGASNHLSPAGIDLTALYLDADNANEGALVTLLVT
jgi:hypothetical protein